MDRIDPSDVRPEPRRWDLHRDCALTPGQCAAGLSIPLLVGSAIAAGCAGAGYTLVAVFAVAEWIAAAVAFVAYARHARDGESVTLRGDELVIDLRRADRTTRVCLNAQWVRVAWDPACGGVECACQRQRWSLGRHVVARARRQFAAELARELRNRQRCAAG